MWEEADVGLRVIGRSDLEVREGGYDNKRKSG